MDPLRHLAETEGFFTRTAAEDCGTPDRIIAAMVRQKLWHRIRRGYYTYNDLWLSLDATQRHAVLSRAVLHSLEGNVVLSHASALVQHGVATWDMDLTRVHVTRLDDGAGRIERDVVHHRSCVPDHDVREVDGLPTIEVARALVEAGSRTSGESALVSFDSALFQGLVGEDELCQMHLTMQRWPGTQHLHIPVRMASGKSQSVGESRGNWLFWRAGLPAPVQQFEVYDGSVLVGITDWAWPRLNLLGEFDGRVKYTRLVPRGKEPGDVVFEEKKREDLLRRVTGMGMVRLVWSDYQHPQATIGRLRQAMGLAG